MKLSHILSMGIRLALLSSALTSGMVAAALKHDGSTDPSVSYLPWHPTSNNLHLQRCRSIQITPRASCPTKSYGVSKVFSLHHEG